MFLLARGRFFWKKVSCFPFLAGGEMSKAYAYQMNEDIFTGNYPHYMICLLFVVLDTRT